MSSITIVVAAGFILLGILFLLYNILYFLVTSVPYVRTPRERVTQILAVLQEHESRPYNTLTFMDLGSGLGHMLLAAEKAGFRDVHGYELSPLHVLVSRAWLWLASSRATAHRQDAFGKHLAEADVVYYFLSNLPMKRLADAIRQHAKPGTLVLGLGTALTDCEPLAIHKVPKIDSAIYVYRTPL